MAKKICSYCGAELDPGAMFCGNCGNPAGVPRQEPEPQTESRRCPGCGGELSGNPKFCKYCGAVIAGNGLAGSGSRGNSQGDRAQNSGHGSGEPYHRRFAGRIPQGDSLSRTPQGNGAGQTMQGNAAPRMARRNGAGQAARGNGASQNPVQPNSGQALRAAAAQKAAKLAAAAQPTYSQGNFYLVDFLKYTLRSGNIPSLIYLLLNVCFITLVVVSGMPDNIPAAIGISLLLYLISITIALSPIGEFIVRYQNGCRKIQDPQLNARLQPVFQRVYQKARQQNPSLPDTVQFYICDVPYPNAFAIGRKTVCVTQGLLQMPDLYIEAILGHEFGHLSHHDTDMLLVITVGNMFINFFIFIGRVCINLMLLIAACFVESYFGALMHRFVTVLSNLSINLMIWLWTQIGVLLVMKTSRSNEFEADHFSGELGYGRVLADALEMLENGPGGRPKGIFAALSASHPPTPDRTARLRRDF